ncbi:response regulator [Thomasclavelia cocleata]|uniref:response regulator n=1 Tax=Thomasclavelia cocleata TaxID=69824 RepID=UPI0024312FC2|nr:response regulator [Thomasclavelia cocleata]
MISIGVIDNELKYYTKIYNILVNEFSNTRIQLYNSIHEINHNLDFLLLNIDMSNEDITNFLNNNHHLKIIFLTNNILKIKDAFGPNIYGCILKKDIEKELVKKITKLIKIINNESFITFKIRGIDINVKINSIIYCQYIGNHIVSIIYGNKMININSTSLKKIMEMLDERFIKINYDTVINGDKINNLEDNYLYLNGINCKFEVSVRKRKIVKKYFYENY